LHALPPDPRHDGRLMARLPPPDTSSEDPMARSVLAHLPQSLAAFQRLYGRLWRSPVLDPATKEIARIRNARLTGCGYCRNVRFATARDAGLGEATLDLVEDGYEASALSSRHKAVLRFVDAFLTDPTSFRDEDRRALGSELTRAQIGEPGRARAPFVRFSQNAVALRPAPASQPPPPLPPPRPPS